MVARRIRGQTDERIFTDPLHVDIEIVVGFAAPYERNLLPVGRETGLALLARQTGQGLDWWGAVGSAGGIWNTRSAMDTPIRSAAIQIARAGARRRAGCFPPATRPAGQPR